MVPRTTEWLSVRDAARMAGVHPNTVRAWLREGRVRAELAEGRNGPTYRIPVEELARQRQDSPTPAAQAVKSGLAALLERLASVEDTRLEEARARAAAEARLGELGDLRRQLEDARAEIKVLRAALARELRARKGEHGDV